MLFALNDVFKLILHRSHSFCCVLACYGLFLNQLKVIFYFSYVYLCIIIEFRALYEWRNCVSSFWVSFPFFSYYWPPIIYFFSLKPSNGFKQGLYWSFTCSKKMEWTGVGQVYISSFFPGISPHRIPLVWAPKCHNYGCLCVVLHFLFFLEIYLLHNSICSSLLFWYFYSHMEKKKGLSEHLSHGLKYS